MLTTRKSVSLSPLLKSHRTKIRTKSDCKPTARHAPNVSTTVQPVVSQITEWVVEFISVQHTSLIIQLLGKPPAHNKKIRLPSCNATTNTLNRV